MIKSFDRQGPRVVRMLHEIMVIVFDHLGITTWRGIDQRWLNVEKVLKIKSLTKSRNDVIYWKELIRDKDRDHWGLGEPEYVALDDLWALCKNDGLEEVGDTITAKDWSIDLNRALCLIISILMCKNHHNMVDENIYYVRNDNQKPFKVVILKYAECVCEMFEMTKLLSTPIRNNEGTMKPPGTPGTFPTSRKLSARK